MTKQDKKKEKQERLAQALRDNLRRRKEQDLIPAQSDHPALDTSDPEKE